ncbi:hypothetical protein ACLMJK_002151 [Lecanora helva]
MSSWLRRLSRDRASKDDRDLPMPSRPFSDNPNAGGSHQSPPYKDTQYSSGFNSQDRLQSYRPSTAGDQGYNATPRGPPPAVNSSADRAHQPMMSTMEPTPDPLTKAFNEAIRPFQDQIEDLKNKLDDAQYHIGQLEEERQDMHAWIDKRGLRADVPQSIFQAMNSDPTSAQTLNYQLDRKMTVLNHDLHRLQDSLSSHLPTATFATTLAQLIPSIEELNSLPGGTPLAFELVLKLGGNLNSHGGDDGWNNDADARSRADFYNRLDECMLDVVQQRLQNVGREDPPWMLSKDIKRMERTGAFLNSKLGLQSYFPRSLSAMRHGEEQRMPGGVSPQ